MKGKASAFVSIWSALFGLELGKHIKSSFASFAAQASTSHSSCLSHQCTGIADTHNQLSLFVLGFRVLMQDPRVQGFFSHPAHLLSTLCMCMHVSAGTHGRPEALDPLELELLRVVSSLHECWELKFWKSSQ